MKFGKLTTLFIICSLLFSSIPLCSRSLSTIDSLMVELKHTTEDTVRINTYLSLCEECYPEDNLKYAKPAIMLADKLLTETTDLSVKKKIVAKKAAFYSYLRVYYSEFSHDSQPLLSYCNSLLSDYQTLHDSVGIVNTTLQISYYYYSLYNAPKAMDFCQLALKLATNINYKYGIAQSLTTKAMLYKDYGNIQQAFIHIEQALLAYEAVKDTDKLSDVLKQQGDFYSQMKQVDEAVACYKRAITLNKAMNSNEGLRDAYNQLGLIYKANNDKENAMINYRIALGYAEHLLDKTWLRGILGNMGDIYREQGDLSRALEFHTKAMHAVKGLNMERQEAWVNRQLALDYIQFRNFKKAKIYNDNYLHVMKKFGLKEGISNGEKLAATIDSSTGNFKGAFLHHKEYIYWRDQLNDEEIKKRAVKEKFQTEFDEQKKRDVLIQNQKDAIAKQQLHTQIILRNSFIAGSILLLLLIVVLINRNRLKRKMEVENMRSRLSRDLHDDIGSTLSSINILSRTAQRNAQHSGDEKTKETLEKINERSQRLLSNMSDIIWNINPANDSIDEVVSRMREYATTILEANQIDYEIIFPREKLNIAMSMELKNNLYLIFKEAVNNLVKYSGCKKAILELAISDKSINLTIEDNGVGFEIDTLTRQGGLHNMQHRAEEMNALFEVVSTKGRGTKIQLTICP